MRFLLPCRFTFSVSLMVAMGSTVRDDRMLCTDPGTPGTGGAGGAQNPPTRRLNARRPSKSRACAITSRSSGIRASDVALRNKYIAAFGIACYMSEVSTFDCFYKKWQAACADAVKIGEVSGNAPYDKGYTCQPVGSTATTRCRSARMSRTRSTINYQAAPRQTPLIEVNGMPTEVNGPYRNLTEPADVGPGHDVLQQQRHRRRRRRFPHPERVDPPGQPQRDTTARFTPISRASRGLVRRTAVRRRASSRTFLEIRRTPPVTRSRAGAPRRAHEGQAPLPVGHELEQERGGHLARSSTVYLTNNDPPAEEVMQLNNAPAYTP